MLRIIQRAAAAAACAVAFIAFPSIASAQISINSTIDQQVAPFTPATGRVNRNGVASACGSVKAYPATFGAGGSYAYRTHSVVYSGAPACVTITISASGCTGTAQTHVNAYSTFNPAALATGFLGDPGLSADTGTPQSFGIDMTTGQSIQLVVLAPSTNATVGACSYNITSAQLNLVGAVPTLSEWSLIGLGGLLAIGGVFYISRRRVMQKI